MMNALLKSICALPTAPFCEQAVIEFVQRFCARHGVPLKQDQHGNLLIGEPRKRAGRWIMVAHMDHPGLVITGASRRNAVRARFRGFVLASHMRGVPVIVWEGNQPVRGKILRAVPGERGAASEVVLHLDGRVSTGSPGMFDFTVARQSGHLLHSRALDDLAGVAAALQALVNVRRTKPRAPVAVLLTRAEEVGFIGAIAAARDGKLIHDTDRIISIECSAMQPYAPQGKGALIRVGDRTSVFDSGLTYLMTETAKQLAKRRKTFQYQRALMPGGTCEATVFDVYGYRAAAVCVPLGNYHNMVPNKKKLAAEYIDLRDWESLVTLLTEVTKVRTDGLDDLRKRLERQFRGSQRLLRRE